MYRIGGRAHTRGITFESDMARIRVTENSHDIQRLFSARTYQLKTTLKRIPLLRVFPAFGKSGTLLIILIIALLLAEVFAPGFFESNMPDTLFYTLLAGGIILLLFVVFLARKRIERLLQYHGAEHMAINTYRKGQALTLENIAQADRATPSCGSSFMLVFLIIAVPLMFINARDYVLLIALCVAFELTLLARRVKWLRWLLRFGMWMQRRIFTRVPDAAQIDVARHGLCTLIAIMDRETAVKKANHS